jgi:hypothetical protein
VQVLRVFPVAAPAKAPLVPHSCSSASASTSAAPPEMARSSPPSARTPPVTGCGGSLAGDDASREGASRDFRHRAQRRRRRGCGRLLRRRRPGPRHARSITAWCRCPHRRLPARRRPGRSDHPRWKPAVAARGGGRSPLVRRRRGPARRSQRRLRRPGAPAPARRLAAGSARDRAQPAARGGERRGTGVVARARTPGGRHRPAHRGARGGGARDSTVALRLWRLQREALVHRLAERGVPVVHWDGTTAVSGAMRPLARRPVMGGRS